MSGWRGVREHAGRPLRCGPLEDPGMPVYLLSCFLGLNGLLESDVLRDLPKV